MEHNYGKNKRLRVLFLANIPSPYRVDFFNEFGKYCDLTVCFEGTSATDRDSKWVGNKAIGFSDIYLKGVRTGSDNFLCLEILRILNEKWDAIILGGYSTPTLMLTIEYLKIKKIEFFIEVDGGLISEENKVKYAIKKHFIASAKGWFSSGLKTNEYLTHYGADENRCFIYPFTSLTKLDFEKTNELLKIEKNEYKARLGIIEDKILLSVGRFSYQEGYGKGYDTLMRCAEILDNKIGIYIVGDNPTEEFITWKENKNLTNVHFVGFKTKQELAYYYAAADVFVLMTRSDVWGLVINEAMMFNLPIITTEMCVAGVELVKENENGFVLSVDDSINLKNKVELLLNDEELLRRYSENSGKKILGYTIEEMAIRHIKYLEEIL